MSTKETMTLKQLRDQIQAFATQKPRDLESANYYVEMNVLLLDDWWKSIDAHLASKPAEQPRGEYPECSGDPLSCPENEGHGCCGFQPKPRWSTDDLSKAVHALDDLVALNGEEHDEAAWNLVRATLTQPAEKPRGAQPSNEKLGRFGHHPDPATDFCVEAECLIGELYNASVGFEKESPSREELDLRISAALSFVVGGDPFAVRAKQQLRAALTKPKPEQAVGDGVDEETTVRYCPECSHLGEVHSDCRDCCPDGSKARYIPVHIAEAAQRDFRASITPRPAVATPVNPYERAVIEQAMVTECVSIDGRDPADVIRDIISWHVSMNSVATPADPVAYLDIGAGGYLDVGSDLTDEQLAKLPKGRHMLGIVGTYGADGYTRATPAEVTGDLLGIIEWHRNQAKVNRAHTTANDTPRAQMHDKFADTIEAALTAQCQVRKDGGVTDDVGEPVTQKLDKALGDLSNAVEDIETGKHQSAVLSFLRSVREYVEDARDDIAAIASPSAGAVVPEGWLPIDTAPNDGTMHVRGLHVYGPDGAFLYWDAITGYVDGEGGAFFDMGGDAVGWDAADFTHWHPLAAAPEVPKP